MQMLEGLHDRALALDGQSLQVMRWGAEQERVPLKSLEPSELLRDDDKHLLKADEERYRLGFGAVVTNIWLPPDKKADAEAFAAAVDAAREASG